MLRFETQGALATAVQWGGHTLLPGTAQEFVGSRIGQSGLHYDAYQGSSAVTPCNFNADAACDLADLDLLYAQGNLISGVIVAPGNQFDLTGDATINNDDLDVWLSSAASLNGFSTPYQRGDADDIGSTTSRDVDITDFNRLAINFDPLGNNAPHSWADANFDGDDDIDITDFNFLAVNFSPSSYAATTSVPEPASTWIALCGVLLTACYLARGRRATALAHQAAMEA